MTSQCEWQPIETLLQKDGLVLLLFYGGIIRIGRKSEGLFVCSLNIANTDVHVTCMGNDLPTGWKQLPDIPVDELSLIANKKAMEAAAESDDWNAAQGLSTVAPGGECGTTRKSGFSKTAK